MQTGHILNRPLQYFCMGLHQGHVHTDTAELRYQLGQRHRDQGHSAT